MPKTGFNMANFEECHQMNGQYYQWNPHLYIAPPTRIHNCKFPNSRDIDRSKMHLVIPPARSLRVVGQISPNSWKSHKRPGSLAIAGWHRFREAYQGHKYRLTGKAVSGNELA
jgi:hypothetical protein